MKNKAGDRKHMRTFGFGLTGLLLLLAGVQMFKGHPGLVLYFIVTSFIALCVSFVVPFALKPIYIPMMFIAQKVSWVNTRILLGIIFYLVFSPIGVFLRIIRKDLLNRKFDKTSKSYWEKRDKQKIDFTRYEKQF